MASILRPGVANFANTRKLNKRMVDTIRLGLDLNHTGFRNPCGFISREIGYLTFANVRSAFTDTITVCMRPSIIMRRR